MDGADDADDADDDYHDNLQRAHRLLHVPPAVAEGRMEEKGTSFTIVAITIIFLLVIINIIAFTFIVIAIIIQLPFLLDRNSKKKKLDDATASTSTEVRIKEKALNFQL